MRRPASPCPILLPLLLALCGAAAGAAPRATPPPAVQAVDHLLILRGPGEAEAPLAGIRLPGCSQGPAEEGRCREAVDTARAFLAGSGVRLVELGHDRWRRPLLAVAEPGGEGLAERLLRAGLALADPLGLPRARAARLLAAEREARERGAGIWGVAGVALEAAATVRSRPMRFRLVCGRVRRAADTRYWFYLNFGADRRRDFTVRLAPALARTVRARGAAPRALEGREICVRGWIFDAGGAMIELVDPMQIEVLP